MVIILDDGSSIINPPSYGEYLIEILKISYRTESDYNSSKPTIHVCLDSLDKLTRCNGINQPALFTILKGYTVWESVHSFKNYVHIRQPTTIYFTDNTGKLISKNTPIITFSMKLLKKNPDYN